MAKLKDTKNKKKYGVMRCFFPYGTDEWDFGYITAFYMHHFFVIKSIIEANVRNLKVLEDGGVIKFCKDAEIARIKQEEFKANSVQTIGLIRSSDELANLMVQNGGTEFTQAFLERLREKHTRFNTGQELEKFYLPIATEYIRIFNENYSRLPYGKVILAKTWGDKKR